VWKRNLQRNMYEVPGASLAPRVTLAALGCLCVALACWLLLAGGLDVAHSRIAWIGPTGDAVRRVCLAVAFSIYYIRILFTEFVFLKRGVSWSEAFTIVPWLLVVLLFLATAGGTNPAGLGAAGVAGIVLFVMGSWMNSYAEYARHVWKQRPENRGKLYTEGLFRYSRHPNYLGDLFLFSGMCMIAGSWVTAVVPALMLVGFVFVNIPILDSHLHDKYGAAFDEYAARTHKLIPFAY
jgi:protein-S-isoprenylcysteine O-methyltransferase Ste14